MKLTRIAVAGLAMGLLAGMPGTALASRTAPFTRVPADLSTDVLGAPTSGTVVTQGRFMDRAGRPTSGGIAAVAWPSESAARKLKVGDVVTMKTVAWARADSFGRYVLRMDFAKVPAGFVNASGVVNALLIGWNDNGQVETFATLRPSGGSRRLAATDLRSNDGVHVRPTISPGSMAASSGPGSVSPLQSCTAYVLRSTKVTPTVVGETWPYGPHVGNVIVSTGHSTSTGGAVTLLSGVWAASGSTTTSSVVTDDYNGDSTVYRDYRLDTMYGYYWSSCGAKWVAMYETGTGFTNSSLSGFPNWSYCGTAKGHWSRTTSGGNHYTMSTGVKIADKVGFDLSVDTSYDTSRTIDYYYNGSYNVCGNDNYAAFASKVQSKP